MITKNGMENTFPKNRIGEKFRLIYGKNRLNTLDLYGWDLKVAKNYDLINDIEGNALREGGRYYIASIANAFGRNFNAFGRNFTNTTIDGIFILFEESFLKKAFYFCETDNFTITSNKCSFHGNQKMEAIIKGSSKLSCFEFMVSPELAVHLLENHSALIGLDVLEEILNKESLGFRRFSELKITKEFYNFKLHMLINQLNNMMLIEKDFSKYFKQNYKNIK